MLEGPTLKGPDVALIPPTPAARNPLHPLVQPSPAPANALEQSIMKSKANPDALEKSILRAAAKRAPVAPCSNSATRAPTPGGALLRAPRDLESLLEVPSSVATQGALLSVCGSPQHTNCSTAAAPRRLSFSRTLPGTAGLLVAWMAVHMGTAVDACVSHTLICVVGQSETLHTGSTGRDDVLTPLLLDDNTTELLPTTAAPPTAAPLSVPALMERMQRLQSTRNQAHDVSLGI